MWWVMNVDDGDGDDDDDDDGDDINDDDGGSISAPRLVYDMDVSGWQWEARLCRICQDAFESVNNIGEQYQ